MTRAPRAEGGLTDEDELSRRRRSRLTGSGRTDDSRRETTDAGLGPVGEFTLTLSDDIVKQATSGLRADRPPADDEAEEEEEEEEEAPAPIREPSERRRARAQETFTLPPDPPSDVRFAKPRPGSRAFPPPSRPSTPAVEPLTTGVVPGAPNPLITGVVRDPKAVGPYTAELMLDGLEESRAPRETPAPKKSRAAAQVPVIEPMSDSLPDVPMPPPDTGRARPLTAAPPRASAMRPQPAARPEARPRRRNSKPPITETGAVKRLEELLTLAEEPPEGEDSGSRIDLLSMSEAPPERESTLGGTLEEVDDDPSLAPRPPAPKPAGRPVPADPRPAAARPAAAIPSRPAAPPPPQQQGASSPASQASQTEFTPLGAGFVDPGSDFNESLTSALILVEEGDQGMLPRGSEVAAAAPAAAAPAPAPTSARPAASSLATADRAGHPRPSAASRPGALGSVDGAAPLSRDSVAPSLPTSLEPSDIASDPLATRKLPGREAKAAAPAPAAAKAAEPAAAAPAPAKKAKEKPAPESVANDPTVLTVLPPAPPPEEAKNKAASADSTKLRRETYKPPAAEKPKKDAPADSFGSEKDYREPILAWLASLIGLVIIGGGIFIALLLALMLM